MITIPKDFPVQPLGRYAQPKHRATCGTCGLSWDDGVSTSITPTPSGRCPFEYFHEEPLTPDARLEIRFNEFREWFIVGNTEQKEMILESLAHAADCIDEDMSSIDPDGDYGDPEESIIGLKNSELGDVDLGSFYPVLAEDRDTIIGLRSAEDGTPEGYFLSEELQAYVLSVSPAELQEEAEACE